MPGVCYQRRARGCHRGTVDGSSAASIYFINAKSNATATPAQARHHDPRNPGSALSLTANRSRWTHPTKAPCRPT